MAKKQNFEESLDELENIVKKLEQGDITLDQSLEFFEKGVSLYKYCQSELVKANQKVNELSKSLNKSSIEDD
jgi:exodeoxyribonuclease VII small subunit